ncbi:MAG TPA: hypothetical protein VHS99_24355 [Chloroflexota bacterium]|jgi:hypothetical protein|nr:hypothetical protein [Chloroflexota bacterium]
MGQRRSRIEHEADRYRAQNERRLAMGGFAIVAVAGGIVLWLRYGATASTVAVAVVLAGAGLLTLLWLLLSLLEAWARSE